jgi:hypothetical protein
VQLCFDFYMIEAKPENLIGDPAYDSDPLDEELETTASRRSRPPFQPSQAAHARLARTNPLYATLARRALLHLDTWQASHTRRWEFHAQNFLGFVQLACLIVLFGDREIGSS